MKDLQRFIDRIGKTIYYPRLGGGLPQFSVKVINDAHAQVLCMKQEMEGCKFTEDKFGDGVKNLKVLFGIK